jgi:hypothetical protein
MSDPIQAAWRRAARCVDTLAVGMKLADGSLLTSQCPDFFESLPFRHYSPSDLRHIMVARVGRTTQVGEQVYESAHHAAYYTAESLINQVSIRCPSYTVWQLIQDAIRSGRISRETADRISEWAHRPEVVMRAAGVRRQDLRRQIDQARAGVVVVVAQFAEMIRSSGLTTGIWKGRLMEERKAAAAAPPPIEPSLSSLLNHSSPRVRDIATGYQALLEENRGVWFTLEELAEQAGRGFDAIRKDSKKWQDAGILVKAPGGRGFRVGRS